MSSAFDPEFGQFEIVLLSNRDIDLLFQFRIVFINDIKFHQSLFRTGMGRNHILFRESPHVSSHQIGTAGCHFQQLRFSGCIIIMYPCFHQHTGIVHIVLPTKHSSPFSPLMVSFHQLSISIDITIGLRCLCLSYSVDISVDTFLQSNIRLSCHQVCHPTDCFVNKSVKPGSTCMLTDISLALCHTVKVLKRITEFSRMFQMLPFKLVKDIIHRHLLPKIQFGFPKCIFYFHLAYFRKLNAGTSFIRRLCRQTSSRSHCKQHRKHKSVRSHCFIYSLLFSRLSFLLMNLMIQATVQR